MQNDEPQIEKMQINYEELRDKIKRMVNVDIVGRVVIRNMLYEDHNLQTTEHQVRTLISTAKYNLSYTWAERQKQDQKIIRLLKRIAGEEQYHKPKNPFNQLSKETIPPTAPLEVEPVDEDTMVTVDETTLEESLRTKYGINDPNWIPVAVWGDMRNPMVKWERKKSGTRHEEYLQHIELKNLPHSTELQPKEAFSERIAILSLRDAHFGLLTEHPAPYEKYDLEEATSATVTAGEELMRAAFDNHVTKLVIPVGSDLLHVDGNGNTTTKGTRQDTNSFWWDAFNAAINALNQIIAVAKEHFDQVIIPIEPGNHDATLSRAVGIAMKSAWGSQSNVSILDNPETLKRISFGNTHLFMHHGNSMKPALLQSWIYAKHPDVIKPGSYVEVLCGHYHHRSLKKLREPGDYFEFGGMMIRITPALCPASNWSESQGYVSSPGGQLTIYDEVGFVSLHEWNPSRM